MIRPRLLLGLGLLAVLVGCTKQPGPPSPAFKQATGLYLDLLRRDLGDVYADPKLEEAVTLLGQVPADSIDAPAAKALADKLQAGIAQAKADQASRAADALQALAPVAAPAFHDEAEPAAPPSEGEPIEATATVKEPLANGPAAGMSAKIFLAKFGSCFSKSSTFADAKGGGSGDVYTLGADPACGRRFPGFAKQLVLVAGDKISSVVPSSAIISQTAVTLKTPHAATAPAPAQAPAPAPAAPVYAPIHNPADNADYNVRGSDTQVGQVHEVQVPGATQSP